jgi:hypothetical protein
VGEKFATRCPACSIDRDLNEDSIASALQCRGCDHYHGMNWHPDKGRSIRIIDSIHETIWGALSQLHDF